MLVKFPADDGRIKLARINCEVDMALCKKNHIQAFPSIRIFRAGNDLLVVRPPPSLPSFSLFSSLCSPSAPAPATSRRTNPRTVSYTLRIIVATPPPSAWWWRTHKAVGTAHLRTPSAAAMRLAVIRAWSS